MLILWVLGINPKPEKISYSKEESTMKNYLDYSIKNVSEKIIPESMECNRIPVWNVYGRSGILLGFVGAKDKNGALSLSRFIGLVHEIKTVSCNDYIDQLIK